VICSALESLTFYISLRCFSQCTLEPVSSIVLFLEEHFKNCHYNVSGFDTCVRKGLNSIQSYFKTGLPQYNVLPFDPFFIPEVIVTRGIPNFGFTLTLRNVTETGWSTSKVTKFVSDLNNYKVNTLMPHIVIIMTLYTVEITCRFCQ
jgi:hypothetical protein